jgi:hypothetical protein
MGYPHLGWGIEGMSLHPLSYSIIVIEKATIFQLNLDIGVSWLICGEKWEGRIPPLAQALGVYTSSGSIKNSFSR